MILCLAAALRQAALELAESERQGTKASYVRIPSHLGREPAIIRA
jgi:hypothetical protein